MNDKQTLKMSFDDFERAMICLAVEALCETLHNKEDVETVEPLVEKCRTLASAGETDTCTVELTFYGLLNEVKKCGQA